jgi:hypothetical protein
METLARIDDPTQGLLKSVILEEERAGAILTIQAYIDETGIDGRGRWLLFSALYATTEDWVAFSSRWSAALTESPAVGYFKMDDAVGRSGPFGRLSDGQHAEKLRRLARVFNEHSYGFIETFVAADLDAIGRLLKPRAIKPANEPYFWPFHYIIQLVCASILETSPSYDIPLEIFFDENVIFGPRAKAWYPVIRAMAEPTLHRLMPVEPLFRDDLSTMPLQAADMTAWLHRADRSPEGNTYAWLWDELQGIHRLPGVEFGEDMINGFFESTPIPDDQRWREMAAAKAILEQFFKGGARHYVPKPSTWTELQRNPKKR